MDKIAIRNLEIYERIDRGNCSFVFSAKYKEDKCAFKIFFEPKVFLNRKAVHRFEKLNDLNLKKSILPYNFAVLDNNIVGYIMNS